MRFSFLFLLFIHIAFKPIAVMADLAQPVVEPLETVKLQLNWYHAFQFAGYYAAKEKGFYEQEGLDVHIMERNPQLNVISQVVNGDVQYAVSNSQAFLHYLQGKPLKALAAIFQQSPLVLITSKTDELQSPESWAGKRLQLDNQEMNQGIDGFPVKAFLQQYQIDSDDYIEAPASFNLDDLLENKVDVMAGLLTDPSIAKYADQLNIIRLDQHEIDFYSDILITHQTEYILHPNRVQRFRRATLKGWQYALNNSEELVQLIHSKYHTDSSLEDLHLEAREILKLFTSNTLSLGQIDNTKLSTMSEIYQKLGLIEEISRPMIQNFTINTSSVMKWTEEEEAWLRQHPILKIGVDQDFAPYEWLNSEGKYAGITVDYVNLLQQKLGIRFQIVKHKEGWPELLAAAKNREIDLLFSMVETPGRKQFLAFTQPYFLSPAVIVSGKTQGYIGSLIRLNGKNVAIQQGHSTEELLNKHYPQINQVMTNSIKQALMLVKKGKAHAYIGDATSINYILKKENIQDLMFSGQTEYTSEFRIGVTSQDKILVNILNKALTDITQAQKNEIYNRWGQSKVVDGIEFSEIFKYLVAILLLMTLFVYWMMRLRQSQMALKNSETKMQAIFDSSPECIKVISADGYVMQVNPAGLILFETEDNPSEMIGMSVERVVSLENREAFVDMYQRVLKGYRSILIYQIESLKGNLRWLETLAVPLHDSTTGDTNILAVSRDISEKKQADEKIWKLANYDTLTDLPNRRMFNDHLNHQIKVSERNQSILALLFLDLDHFKEVNDELGHQVGDTLLVETARRIVSCVRSTDVVSRLSGDEFTVILSDLDDKNTAERIAEKIVKTLVHPFEINKEVAYVSVSIGIAIYPDDAENSFDLIKNADLAMYNAKKSGRNCFSYFTQTMQDAALFRLQLMKDLQIALRENQFQLRYQPIVTLETGKISKVEVLLCWNHPDQDFFVTPEQFIPLAEESGLIVEIGNWVFRESIQQLKRWRNQLNIEIQLSINKSPIQFNLRNYHFDWLQLLDENDVDGSWIVIEITENLLLDTSDNVTRRLLEYQQRGIKIAIDDFGTGYSALSYLNKFDIDYLKIDRSFIKSVLTDPSNMALTEAITVMSHKLGLKVIVEGIETEAQRKLLIDAGCDFGQGFYFYKPMPAAELEQILTNQN